MESTSGWKHLGAVPPSSVGSARLEVYAAAWLVSAVGRTLALPEDDHGHVSLSWDEGEGALVGRRVERIRPIRASFRPDRSELRLTADEVDPIGSLALEGRTVAEARAWLEAALAALGTDADADRPSLPAPLEGPLEMAFVAPGLPALEIAAWLSNAAALLQQIAVAAGEAASPVRCWPHHLDIATLITVQPDPDPEQARSIGVGLSLGDARIKQPYWYVGVWPIPADPVLPELQVGVWNTEGWLGPCLTGEAVVGAGSAAEQEEAARLFLDSAIQSAGQILGGSL